jgi:hypothetical protein
VSIKTPTATIADGATESSVVTVGDNLPSGIKTPAGWTTASITFKASESAGGTFVPVYDASGALLTIASAAASRWYAIAPQDLAGVPYLKLVSSVAQAGGDSLIVAMRENG